MTTFNWYVYGQVIKSLEYAIEGNTLIVKNENGIARREIVQCDEFVFDFLKKKVKAINGAEGLKKIIEKINDPKSPTNTFLFSILEKLV